MESIRSSIGAFNAYVGSSTFGRIFRLEGSGHVRVSHHQFETCTDLLLQELEIRNTKFTTELRAGLTTFFTMSYIIAVNVSSKRTCILP